MHAPVARLGLRRRDGGRRTSPRRPRRRAQGRVRGRDTPLHRLQLQACAGERRGRRCGVAVGTSLNSARRRSTAATGPLSSSECALSAAASAASAARGRGRVRRRRGVGAPGAALDRAATPASAASAARRAAAAAAAADAAGGAGGSAGSPAARRWSDEGTGARRRAAAPRSARRRLPVPQLNPWSARRLSAAAAVDKQGARRHALRRAAPVQRAARRVCC